jgi:RimJ/RimL family protein N-acetyltransferase
MIIESERLRLTPFHKEDASDLYDYLSKEEVIRYEPYGVCTFEEAAAQAELRACDEKFIAVRLKNGKLIGNLYFSKEEFETWELGYVFNDTYWKNGYATEAARALLSYAFNEMGIRRVIAKCNPLNTNSWRLLERLGLRREGHLLKSVYFFKDSEGNPIWHDTYEYGLLKEEWKS